MTRIIAGAWGSRRLEVPKTVTRPTSDRVRESVFSVIEARFDLDGATVLDLCAGSGALGLEALSRGAGHCTFVEANANACRVVRANMRSLGAPGVVKKSRIESYVGAIADQWAPYDLVFIDPPYDMELQGIHTAVSSLVNGQWLAEERLIVVERSARTPFNWPTTVQPVKDKKHGETHVWYGH